MFKRLKRKNQVRDPRAVILQKAKEVAGAMGHEVNELDHGHDWTELQPIVRGSEGPSEAEVDLFVKELEWELSEALPHNKISVETSHSDDKDKPSYFADVQF